MKERMKIEDNNYILAKYDVSGIQDYIFADNRLRENAGASYQVTQILEKFLPEALLEEEMQVKGKVKINWNQETELELPAKEELQAEILYIGGGNAVLLLRSMELFQKVGDNLGIKAGREFPGICLAIAYINTDLQDFSADMKKLDVEMERVKSQTVRLPLYSPFPVVEQDNQSHQPIVRRMNYGETTENVTEVRFQKRKAYSNIRNYSRLFPEIDKDIEYEYPEEMEGLCSNQGEDSYIGVIHIDGNGMGQQIKNLIAGNRNYFEGVRQLRKKSVEIASLFNSAYQELLKKLWSYLKVTKEDDCSENDGIHKVKLPLRPIILDGDDFTVLCTADLAIPVAAGFLKELDGQQKNEEKKITACAGIAFVHSHFPFYAAYTIAEDSCSRAKTKWYQEKEKQRSTEEEKVRKREKSYLDFEVIKGSDAGRSAAHMDYRIRPYSVVTKKGEDVSDSLTALYDCLKRMEDKWPRNRLHKIYHALLQGNTEMELTELEFASRGYQRKELTEGDWKLTPLFDALELQGLCRLDMLKNLVYGEGDTNEELELEDNTEK